MGGHCLFNIAHFVTIICELRSVTSMEWHSNCESCAAWASSNTGGTALTVIGRRYFFDLDQLMMEGEKNQLELVRDA